MTRRPSHREVLGTSRWDLPLHRHRRRRLGRRRHPLRRGALFLPFETQEREIRRHVFHSTALFDLLRRRLREEGLEDRRRGIRLGELALVSLERSEPVFGERIHDLRALGWAWLGRQ